MFRNYLCVEVVILLLLSHVGWNGPSSPRVQPCSRAQSRIARGLIRRRFTNTLQRYRVPLSPECPFHPTRDVFWWPQAEDSDWSCPVCGQDFFCEESLTSHWDKAHAPHAPKPEDGVCLADYCDILRCDVLGPRLVITKQDYQEQIQPSKTKRNCEGAAAAIDPRCSCDEKRMQALQHKCRIVIQQCVMGLLSALSVKDFQDIEEELNNGICSYLTCNKYWDDSVDEVHHVPVFLGILIGSILVGGFFLCYYVVWVLFNPPPYEEVYCNGGLHFSNFGNIHHSQSLRTHQCPCCSPVTTAHNNYYPRRHYMGRR
ncbi:uncharacterized protein LOC135378043 isoform X2 [Ornithodoros turicata]|uniref:uncharacterized protein LOC135378043 isoform X2 n=1 Tax=Ornithodoros turicata TaxID=34597 RepID=UPI003139CE91